MSISDILLKLAQKQAKEGNSAMAERLANAAKCSSCGKKGGELSYRKDKGYCSSCSRNAKCALKGCDVKMPLGEMYKQGDKAYCCSGCAQKSGKLNKSASDMSYYTKRDWDSGAPLPDGLESYIFDNADYITDDSWQDEVERTLTEHFSLTDEPFAYTTDKPFSDTNPHTNRIDNSERLNTMHKDLYSKNLNNLLKKYAQMEESPVAPVEPTMDMPTEDEHKYEYSFAPKNSWVTAFKVDLNGGHAVLESVYESEGGQHKRYKTDYIVNKDSEMYPQFVEVINAYRENPEMPGLGREIQNFKKKVLIDRKNLQGPAAPGFSLAFAKALKKYAGTFDFEGQPVDDGVHFQAEGFDAAMDDDGKNPYDPESPEGEAWLSGFQAGMRSRPTEYPDTEHEGTL